MAEPLLQVRDVCKNFGGLAAVDSVSLDLHIGRLHAVIGPNGAGKSTLINLLSGELALSRGRVLFQGRDVASLAPEQRSRLGFGRTYQKVNVFPSFTALENCRIAAQSRRPHPLRWLRPATRYADVTAEAQRALAAVGLADRSESLALSLSHGDQRQLEIAMALATAPRLLLLDEPLAGMGAEESARMIALIGRLAQSHGILLVEHDMDAIFRLAEVLTVMVDGKVIASGAPDDVRADRAVQTAYLGSGGAA